MRPKAATGETLLYQQSHDGYHIVFIQFLDGFMIEIY